MHSKFRNLKYNSSKAAFNVKEIIMKNVLKFLFENIRQILIGVLILIIGTPIVSYLSNKNDNTDQPPGPSETGTYLDNINKSLEGINITYFQKNNDNKKITDALSNMNINFEKNLSNPILHNFTTNAIACAPDTPVEAIKKLSILLIKSGVDLQVILPFQDPSSKPKEIEILAVGDGSIENPIKMETAPLAIEQINRLNRCPEAPLVNRPM